MYNKERIISDPDFQLSIIRHYYPQADSSGKFFKVREENTPSTKLRSYKGVWYLKDFGDTKKAQDCFAVVMDKESCSFSEALKVIEKVDPSFVSVKSNTPSVTVRISSITKQVDAIKSNTRDQGKSFLKSRHINTDLLPNNSYYYDSYLNAVVFLDSEEKVINRRLIAPKDGSKARMSKYSGYNPIYGSLYISNEKRVYITEGVIDSLSLFGKSTISIFTTSNLITDKVKLNHYLQGKEIIIAFDNDKAGNACSDYYTNQILEIGLETEGIYRLLLPLGKDLNDLLIEGTLNSLLDDEENYIDIGHKENVSADKSFEKDDDKTYAKSFGSTKNDQIEEFITSKYNIRYNSIKQQPEYRKIEAYDSYLPVDKYYLNSLKRELNQNGLLTTVQNIKSILESDYCVIVHPIKEYLIGLSEWGNGYDYIKELANTVTVKNPDTWYKYLKKWLVAVVANIINDKGCQNHTCLVITGKQGAFKTTWLDNLCPTSLAQYLFTGKIDPSNKDSLTYIAEYLFVNIDDQLKQLNKRDENELKNLITTPSVKYRRPYDIYITEYPHTASFMASVNGNDFLTDPTGSRRFLPFEALEIDIEKAKKINIDMVYAQAIHLYREGFIYWFNHEEIEELHKHNQVFQVVSTEEQFILEYFDKPADRDSATDYLQSAVIHAYLEKFAHIRLSAKKLGEALTKLGYDKWQRTNQGKTKWVWSVIKKELPNIEDENNNNPL